MDSIRFEPSVSATFAVDRNPSGGGDLFADMLGDHMKKRATERPDAPARRKPQADRPIHGEDRPAARRPGVVIKHAHDLRDVATDARDVTPRKEEQARLPSPGMDDQLPANGSAVNETEADQASVDAVASGDASDKEQPTDQQQPILAPVQVAPEPPPAVAAGVVAIAADRQAPLSIDGQLPAAAEPETATITPAVEPAPVDPQVDPQAGAADSDATNPDTQEKKAGAQANFAATVAASLGDTMAGLIGGDAALDATASADALASANLTTLTTPKVATPSAANTPHAAAAELAATITPEAPRPAADIKTRPTARAVPASEIKAQVVAAQSQPNQAPQAPTAALAQAALSTAFSEVMGDGFDAGFGADGAGAPGWTRHLAQAGAAKRPDFIAQLRQHLQELPAHEQVAVNIQRALRHGTNQMTIQLSPAELGKIHVKLEIDEEKRVTAAVTVEKPSTLELLQRDVKGLERALQDAGLKMDGNDLSFNLGRQDGKEFSQEMRQSGTAGFGNGTGEAPAEGDVSAGQAAAQVDTAAGLVNVQI